MNRFAKFGLVAALTLILGLTAAADERKLIEKKPADREPTTDQEFLVRAIACEVAEVKMGEYVAKNAINQDVRKFAEQMVTDHTKMRDQLLNRARDMKLGVAEGFDKEKQDKFDQIKKLKGSDFDREYMKCMVEGHEKALQLHEKWSTAAKDQKLRDDLKNGLPTLREHLDHARKILNSLKS